MKILIITDSLGAPRDDDDGVENSWVYKFIDKHKEDAVIYTYCWRGLTLANVNMSLIKDFKPDILICQIGTVDCARRVMGYYIGEVVKRIPVLSGIVHFISQKFHLQLTRLYNVHYCKYEKFEKIISSINNCSSVQTYWITIAPTNSRIKELTYNRENDRKRYNEAFKKTKSKIIDPWENLKDADDIYIEDGVHLNTYGHSLVFEALEKAYSERGI